MSIISLILFTRWIACIFWNIDTFVAFLPRYVTNFNFVWIYSQNFVNWSLFYSCWRNTNTNYLSSMGFIKKSLVIEFFLKFSILSYLIGWNLSLRKDLEEIINMRFFMKPDQVLIVIMDNNKIKFLNESFMLGTLL